MSKKTNKKPTQNILEMDPRLLRDRCQAITEAPHDARAMPATSEAPHGGTPGMTKRAAAEQVTLDEPVPQRSESWIS